VGLQEEGEGVGHQVLQVVGVEVELVPQGEEVGVGGLDLQGEGAVEV